MPVAVLLALAAVGWWWTVDRMRGMDDGPGTALGTLGWFVGVWVVMMAAMMFPSVAPAVELYARLAKRRDLLAPVAFASGYLLAWAAVGVLAFGASDAGRRVFGARLEWHRGGRALAGGVLLVATVYELTPVKTACLSRCRSLLGSWRDGVSGALPVGTALVLIVLGLLLIVSPGTIPGLTIPGDGGMMGGMTN